MNHNLRHWIRSAFEFSGSETGAFTVLLPLLLLVMTSGRIYRKVFPEKPPEFIIEIVPDSVFAARNNNRMLFAFDPNTADSSAFEALGISPRLAARILKYRSRGGTFRKPADLASVYGMDSLLFRRLEPWIRITAQPGRDTTRFRRMPAQPARIIQYDLNRADTADFESVVGIGKKTAARIIRYRSALGGFVNKDQLYEVYGIDSLAVFSMDRFTVEDVFVPAKLAVNSATVAELEVHPYLSALQARAILMYRFQHGRIEGESGLMKVRLMDSGTLERIRPYLDFR